VLDGDVIAEEPCPLAAGMRDQGLGAVQFQPEIIPEKSFQRRFDLLCFGPGADKTQQLIISLFR